MFCKLSKSLVETLDEIDVTGVKKLLDRLNNTTSQTDLFSDVLQTFKELAETLDETDVNGVKKLLYQLLPSYLQSSRI